MKLILILSLLIMTLFADGFKYIKIIKNNTPIDNIVKIINNVQSGTVLRFENGTYDFKNQEIIIDNKNYISIEGRHRDKTIIKNLKLFYNNSNYSQLNGLTYNRSFLSFFNTKDSYAYNLRLEKSQISITSSTCVVQNVISQKEHKYVPIRMDSSTVEVSKVDIENKMSGAIYAKNSNLTLFNCKLSSTNATTLFSDSSNINIWGNTFKNDNTFDSKGTLSFIVITNSKAFIHKNKFDNFNFGIKTTNSSLSEIFNNEFSRFTYAVIINTKSKSRILDNTMKYSINYGRGVYIHNAQALIQHNEFDYIYVPIHISNSSEAQIVINKILTITDIKNSKGLGIRIDEGCLANIWDNTILNSKYSYIGRAHKKSHVYLSHNDKGFSLPGLGDPQVVDNPYKFNFIDPFYDFRKDMKKVKIANFSYKYLKIIQNDKELSNKFKGYLMEDIAISFDDYDDVITKGTYVVIENNTIIEPKEYKGGKCQNIPKLGFDKVHRNIKIIPIFDNQKNLLKFKITSKVPLRKISFDNIPLKYYKTKNLTRARKIRDFEKTYILKIEGKNDKFEEIYSCRFDKTKKVTCRKKEKL